MVTRLPIPQPLCRAPAPRERSSSHRILHSSCPPRAPARQGNPQAVSIAVVPETTIILTYELNATEKMSRVYLSPFSSPASAPLCNSRASIPLRQLSAASARSVRRPYQGMRHPPARKRSPNPTPTPPPHHRATGSEDFLRRSRVSGSRWCARQELPMERLAPSAGSPSRLGSVPRQSMAACALG